MRRLVLWPMIGVLLTAVMVVVPPFVASKLASKSEPVSPAVRLAFTPDAWPDPNVTWRQRLLGAEELTSMLGIGVEHMQMVERLRAGWPMPVLEGWTRSETLYDHGTRKTTVIDHGQRSVGVLGGREWGRRMPTGLLPMGLAANLAFWTLVPWLVFAAPGAIRRALRRRRGCCEACGYPRQGERCPECGTAWATAANNPA